MLMGRKKAGIYKGGIVTDDTNGKEYPTKGLKIYAHAIDITYSVDENSGFAILTDIDKEEQGAITDSPSWNYRIKR